ncbi:class I SAM-dependent methyltransferase [Desulfolithobacter sp.]
MNMSGGVLLEDVGCPLGCAGGDNVVLEGRDLLHDLPGTFTVVKCRTCGLMRTNPRPAPESIGFYYPDDYGPYAGTRVRPEAPGRSSVIKRLLRPVVSFLVDYKTSALPSIPPGNLLELGCASGAFMHQMAQRGWRVEGIEFSSKAAMAATQLGYHVYAGPLETAPAPDKLFDLVVGWMVVEHLHDPVGGLRKLREWTRPGGWLVISVPNAGSLEFKIFKEKWYALQLPTHLYHYTPRSISQVLEAGGWSLVKVYHQRVLSNLFPCIGYVLREKGYDKLGEKLIGFPENAGRWHQILYPLAWLLSQFGQTGRMTIWARNES